MNNISSEQKYLQLLAERVALPEYNGRAYLVGGSVRDEILGIPHKDYDVEVFGIPEEQLEWVLRGFIADMNFRGDFPDYKFSAVGKSFKVFKVGPLDVSLPRKDVKIAPGHTGFEVTSDPFMSVKEAASRRDFTINAIYKNILTGEITDPFHGREDLNVYHNIGTILIRMVDKNVFAEDPLRVLRAIQFAARFQGTIDRDTYMEMQKVDLSELPAERVWGEIEKLLMKSEKPSHGLELFAANDWGNPHFSSVLPEFAALKDIPQDPAFHPEGSVYIHTLMVVDEATKLIRKTELTYPEKLTVMLAVLCHDLGKTTTTDANSGKLHWDEVKPGVFVPRQRITAHGHAAAGVPLAEKLLDRLGVYSVEGFDVRANVLQLVAHHLVPPQLFREHEKDKGFGVGRAVLRLATKVRLDLLALVSLADMLGRDVSEKEKQHSLCIFDWFVDAYEHFNVVSSAPKPLLLGRHLLELGMKPGPEMGVVLKQAYELQLDGQITTLEEAKVFASKESYL